MFKKPSHKHGLVPSSFIPPLPIRQIRDLMRYRFKLINVKSSEKNRIQNSLTVSNIMISSVVSDTFGVSSMRIINHILDNPDDVDFEVSSMLHIMNIPTLDQIILGGTCPRFRQSVGTESASNPCRPRARGTCG